MSRARFGLLLALLILVVGAGSFVVVLSQLDDDDPGADGAAPSTTASSDTTTTVAVPEGLVTPTFVVIVTSEGDEATARAQGDELTERGYDASVLRSDEYGSLEPGFWVSYVGPFPDVASAEAADAQLAADEYPAAYVRCVGTAEECA